MKDAYKLYWMIYFVETMFKPLIYEIRYLVYVWTTPTVYALMFTVTNKPRRTGYAVFTCIMYDVKCIILVTIINKTNHTDQVQPSWPLSLLTHWGRVTHIYVSKQGHHRSRKWLVAWSAPSHHLNRWRNIVNWALTNKNQWNRKQNSCIFIQENVFENVVWKMATILSRTQCVKRTCGVLKFFLKALKSEANISLKHS